MGRKHAPMPMRNQMRENFWASAHWNDERFLHYYNRLLELSISMFKWDGLPDTVDPRFLELALFGDGMAVYFKDEVIGDLALRCMIGGRLNVYNIPTMRRAYASNGYNKPLDDSNSVIIWNNMIHTNSLAAVELFAKRLWDLDATVDINCKAQKTPVLIACDEKQRLTLKNLYMKYEGNQPFIFGDKSLNPNALKVLQTGAEFVADKIYLIKIQIWNEALTYLGISNVNIQKRERMLMDEVQRNQGGVIASRYSRLESRRQAADQINKMFGTNITVDYREDFQEIQSQFNTLDEDNDIRDVQEDVADV